MNKKDKELFEKWLHDLHDENDNGECWCNPKIIIDDSGVIRQIIHNELIEQ